MKLTWEDIEAHRDAVTPDQWRRIRAYFREGKSLMQIAAAERGGEEPKKAKTSLNLSIGRGCIAILGSMLEKRVRAPVAPAPVVTDSQCLISSDTVPEVVAEPSPENPTVTGP